MPRNEAGIRNTVTLVRRELCLAERRAALMLLAWRGTGQPRDHEGLRVALEKRKQVGYQLRRELSALRAAGCRLEAARAEVQAQRDARDAYLDAMGLPAAVRAAKGVAQCAA